MFRRTAVPSTTVADAHRRAQDELLLDVREPSEWAAGHAPGAVHIPLGQLTAASLSAATRLLCICRSGNRSAQAVAALRRGGYDAVNVDGGMRAWLRQGLPVVSDGDHPGTVA